MPEANALSAISPRVPRGTHLVTWSILIFLLERPYKPVAGGNDAVDEICFIVACK